MTVLPGINKGAGGLRGAARAASSGPREAMA
jgi:hypothetical protein